MPISIEIPTVSFSEASDLLTIAMSANTPVLLLGDPGIGKSALAQLVAQRISKPLVTLLGSTMDPTDVAGIPFLRMDGKAVDRFPLEAIRQACEAPCVLFLDEISCAPPAVQAALLRLILERKAGDATLHEGTRVMAAANPPEQAPAGFELSAPLMGRVCAVKLRPKMEEVLDFFASVGVEGSKLRQHCEDFALTCAAQPDLLQIDIPADCVTGNAPWGAPRSWERALRSQAQADEMGMLTTAADACAALMDGSVGKRQSTAYRAILKLRKNLPTVEEICKSPETARMPEDSKEQISVIGLIGHVANVNTWAACLYIARLPRPEYRQACMKILQRRTPSPMTAAHATKGVNARVKLIADMPRLSR